MLDGSNNQPNTQQLRYRFYVYKKLNHGSVPRKGVV
jgi:hypothetical protein